MTKSKTPNRQDVGLDVGLEKEVLELVILEPRITMNDMSRRLNVTKRTIERIMKKLREENKIVRVGGKRFGYWQINK